MAEIELEALRNASIFASLSDAQLESIRPAVVEVSAEAGSVVMREGEQAYRMYCLISGQVQVVTKYLQEGSQTVALLGPGAVFGEMAFLAEDAVRSATVVTNEPTVLAAIHRDAFRGILERSPTIATTLLFEAYRRLRQANELISVLRAEQEGRGE